MKANKILKQKKKHFLIDKIQIKKNRVEIIMSLVEKIFKKIALEKALNYYECIKIIDKNGKKRIKKMRKKIKA